MAKAPEGWLVLVDGEVNEDGHFRLCSRDEASKIAAECVGRAQNNVFIQRVEVNPDGTVAEIERE